MHLSLLKGNHGQFSVDIVSQGGPPQNHTQGNMNALFIVQQRGRMNNFSALGYCTTTGELLRDNKYMHY